MFKKSVRKSGGDGKSRPITFEEALKYEITDKEIDLMNKMKYDVIKENKFDNFEKKYSIIQA